MLAMSVARPANHAHIGPVERHEKALRQPKPEIGAHLFHALQRCRTLGCDTAPALLDDAILPRLSPA